MNNRNINDIMEGLTAKAVGHFPYKVAIFGHKRPDGDCVGSTTALYHYLEANYHDIEVDLYLEEFKEQFKRVIPCIQRNAVKHEHNTCYYDLIFVCDCGSADRVAMDDDFLQHADEIVVIDHHMSNKGFGNETILDADASSACEVLYELLQKEWIDEETANSLLTGLVHDTGSFRHPNVRKRTMEIVADLIGRGGNLSAVINETYIKKTIVQQQIQAYAFDHASFTEDQKFCSTILRRDILDYYQVIPSDLDTIADSLLGTDGVLASVFLYELNPGQFKISLRSDGSVNVSAISVAHGGGGHYRAAGFDVNGDADELLKEILQELYNGLS